MMNILIVKERIATIKTSTIKRTQFTGLIKYIIRNDSPITIEEEINVLNTIGKKLVFFNPIYLAVIGNVNVIFLTKLQTELTPATANIL